MISSKTKKCDLNFTKSEGDKPLHLKWDTSIPWSLSLQLYNMKILRQELNKNIIPQTLSNGTCILLGPKQLLLLLLLLLLILLLLFLYKFYWVTFNLEGIHRPKFCATNFVICHYADFGNGECRPRIGLFTPFNKNKFQKLHLVI